MPDTKASADPSVTVANVADADSLLGLFASATSTNGRFTFANLRAYLLAGLAVFGASGASAAKGFVPSPGATAGTTRFLREDATWATPGGPKNNYAASSAPTITDDASQGYDTGSSWFIPATGDMWRCRSPTTGAARWVKIDVADHPGYVAGRFYLPFGHGTPVAGTASVAGTIYLAYGVIKQRITVSQLGARVTGAAAGGNLQLAVYSHNPATGLPGTLVTATPSGSTATATLVSVALTANQTIEPGPYWFAYSVDNASAILISNGLGAPAQVSLTGSATAAIPGGPSNASQVAGLSTPGTFGTWPADLSGNTFADVPLGRTAMIQFLVASVP